ncbi:MAG: glycine cleavage T C-terminal barrel domain-containing protein [Leptolyngbyaceae bacterium]|nr:glycine cleavage T C-terminal barrel domain-containing protein [Leptolyngbyaceae bacterium]
MTSGLQDLQALQVAQGAKLEPANAALQQGNTQRTVPTTFGHGAVAIAAAQTRVAVCDRSHWGRIAVGDGDRLRFLHNQSTNSFLNLQAGQGCETVFVTSTARTIDLVSAYARPESVLLLTHPTARSSLIKWMDRFIFFADKVKLVDETDETVTFSLIGPESTGVLEKLSISVKAISAHHHETVMFAGSEILVAVGSGLALPGYTLIAPVSVAATLWEAIATAEVIPLGEAEWEPLRIAQGRPIPGAELTDDYNPLEAGLWHTITFDKGCYIGQETIARLDTYNGVKQQLWGIRLAHRVEPGTPLWLADKKVGRITSVAESMVASGEDEIIGLAYVRTKAGGEGLQLQVGEADSALTATVIGVPFLTRSRQEPAP